MKFIVDGMLQEKIIEFKLIERERKLIEFLHFVSGNPKTVKKKIKGSYYFWVRYDKFIEEYPYLEIPNTKQVGEHAKNLVKKGLLNLQIDRTPSGSYTFVCFTDLYYSLWTTKASNYYSDSHSDSNRTHFDSNRSGNGLKSEWNGGSNRSQINHTTINHTTNKKIDNDFNENPNFENWEMLLKMQAGKFTKEELGLIEDFANSVDYDQKQIKLTINNLLKWKMENLDIQESISYAILNKKQSITKPYRKASQKEESSFVPDFDYFVTSKTREI